MLQLASSMLMRLPPDVEGKLRRIHWPRLLKSVMMMSNSLRGVSAQGGLPAPAGVLPPRYRRGDRAAVHRQLAGAAHGVRLETHLGGRSAGSRQQWKMRRGGWRSRLGRRLQDRVRAG